MNVERLRDVSSAFGQALRNALREMDKEAQVVGGGFRHGEIEWQVYYRLKDLDRFLFFSLDEPSERLLHFAARAGATDSRGRWAYVPIGSTTVPADVARNELGRIASGMLDQGRIILNSLGEEDLRPTVPDYFASDQTT